MTPQFPGWMTGRVSVLLTETTEKDKHQLAEKIISSVLDMWLAGALAGHPGRDVQQADKCCLVPKK